MKLKQKISVTTNPNSENIIKALCMKQWWVLPLPNRESSALPRYYPSFYIYPLHNKTPFISTLLRTKKYFSKSENTCLSSLLYYTISSYKYMSLYEF